MTRALRVHAGLPFVAREVATGRVVGGGSDRVPGFDGTAYLVFSHRQPALVRRLVRTLKAESPGAAVLVHHDDAVSDLELSDLPDPRGVFRVLDPPSMRWGSVLLGLRMLDAFAWVHRHLDCEWTVLLSGQDYPVTHAAAAEAQLAASPTDVYASTAWEGWTLAGLARPRRRADPELVRFLMLRRYLFRYAALPLASPRRPGGRGRHEAEAAAEDAAGAGGPGASPSPVRRAVGAARLWNHRNRWWCVSEVPGALTIGYRARHHPFSPDYPVRIGSCWVDARRPAVAAALAAVDRDPRIVRHFRRTEIADEALLPTVLVNAAPGRALTDDNRRYLRFADLEAEHPDVLTTADLPALLASGAAFARKFDLDVDAEVLDRLDEARAAAGPGSV